MRHIYHLVQPAVWNRVESGPYHADSLAGEGFIHCSNADQVVRIANLLYAGEAELLVLTIDVEKLTSPLKDEAVGEESFPHVHGPINREAVVETRTLARGDDGKWQ